MMSVEAPPRFPDRREPVDRDELEALVEALIEEARQRARRRRRIYAASVALVALVGITALDAAGTTTVTRRLYTFLPNLFVAAILFAAGSILARLLSRGVLISAVNMQVQSARLMSLGVKWLVLVFTAAMALNQVHIGGLVLTLAFGILFGGIVLAMALAVGLGSKDVVSRTWERQAEKRPEAAETVQHL